MFTEMFIIFYPEQQNHRFNAKRAVLLLKFLHGLKVRGRRFFPSFHASGVECLSLRLQPLEV